MTRRLILLCIELTVTLLVVNLRCFEASWTRDVGGRNGGPLWMKEISSEVGISTALKLCPSVSPILSSGCRSEATFPPTRMV